MNEPSPICGSFTIRWDPDAWPAGCYRVSIPNYPGGEVVPVPDEQAIERAVHAARRAMGCGNSPTYVVERVIAALGQSE